MASSKFRRALGAVKDQTSIGLAKVGSSASLADLDIAIVKATRHEEYPTEEKYIREILSLTCYSREFISACINTISRRLNKTKNWIVALKTLMLVQRLLSEGDPAYEQEIFFSTRRGTRFLNMSDFRDTSRSNSWDYSAFVRTYALYLDERLEFRMQSRRGKRSAFGFDEDEFEDPQEAANNFTNQQSCPKATPVHEMKADKLFSRMQHLQQLLERFLACRPTGVAKNNRIVIMALYPIVKESFQIYYDITEIMGLLIDRFMELEIPDCAKVYEIFCRIGKQFDELDMLYGWCKQIGISRSSEYPQVERITPKKLEVMDEYIRDKSALAQGKRSVKDLLDQQKIDEANKDEESNHGEDEEEDMNAMKALPPPEGFVEENNNKEIEPVKEEENKKPQQEEGDLLNLGEDAVSSNEHADKLALALFNGATEQAPAGPPAWEAFANEADWETALVQSASHLSNQKASLGGGFDLLLLDGLYQQAEVSSTMAGPGYGVSGSASSVALGSAGRPAMLALPAPPPSSSSSSLDHPSKSSVHVDPFAASLVVPPPSYVQMSDLERKQKLLMDEQLIWHQYARDGMQGQIGLTKLQHNPHHNINMGGYTHTY